MNSSSDGAGDGGQTTLRGAINAAKGAGLTEIRFEPSVFYDAHTFVGTPIELNDTLTIPEGSHLIIDGSLVYAGFNLEVKGGSDPKRLMTVEAGADVTLRDLTLSNGREIASGGSDGIRGINGQAPTIDYTGVPNSQRQTGISATSGGDGTDSQVAGSPGGDGVGGILNRGKLMLDRVVLNRFEGDGGKGGLGGDGGRGSTGGAGADAVDAISVAGNGGNGGHGADATRGGNGGAAAGAILNHGDLTLRDVQFMNCIAVAGIGGAGGNGGAGGGGGLHGGYGYPGIPGSGGNAGNGGDGGDGGSAAAAIFNRGTVNYVGIQPKPLSPRSDGGHGGAGSAAGSPGNGAVIDFGPETSPSGAPGVSGSSGAAGLAEHFLHTSPEVGSTFIVSVAHDEFSQSGDENSRYVYLRFELLGEPSAGAKIHWVFEGGPGIDDDDFKDGLPAGGELEFSGTTTGKSVGFVINAENKGESDETFTIKLSNPVGADLGASRSVTITIKGN